MHSNWTRPILAAVLIAALTSVCSLPGVGPRTGDGSPEPVAPDEILIPPTTKVLEPDVRGSLQSVDGDGTLHFGSSSTALTGLQPGDVLAIESTTAAPDGLLRKVRATRAEGSGTLVETEGALLTDAVHNGKLEFVHELTEADIRATEWLVPGVAFAHEDSPVRLHGPQPISLSEPGRPQVSVEPIAYSFDTDLGTGGAVRVNGTASIAPILDVSLGIGCNDKWHGICVEIPDINFKTRVGVTEQAGLAVHGNYANSFNREIEVARHTFSAITVYLGPVPVVFVPILTVYLNGQGQLSAKVDYAVNQNLTLAAGFKYNSDTGFEDLSERTANFSSSTPVFEGSAEVRGALGVRFELRLYGIIGPFGALEAGAHFQAALNGLPPDTSVLWRIEGCLWLKVGINSIDVLDLHYEKELYKACAGFGSGVNQPPSVAITSPTGASQIYQGEPFTLHGWAVDPNGGAVTCRWTSSTGGDPFPVNACDGANVSFPSTGGRTLTLTGTDPAGQSASTTVSVNVQARPPVLVTITSPAEGSVVGPDVQITLSSNVSGGAAPFTFTWKLNFPTNSSGGGGNSYLIGSGSSLTWKPSDSITFGGCEVSDYGRLVLEVTDSVGTASSTVILIRIERIC